LVTKNTAIHRQKLAKELAARNAFQFLESSDFLHQVLKEIITSDRNYWYNYIYGL